MKSVGFQWVVAALTTEWCSAADLLCGEQQKARRPWQPPGSVQSEDGRECKRADVPNADRSVRFLVLKAGGAGKKAPTRLERSAHGALQSISEGLGERARGLTC